MNESHPHGTRQARHVDGKAYCNTLQSVAVCCSVLNCVAVCVATNLTCLPCFEYVRVSERESACVFVHELCV